MPGHGSYQYTESRKLKSMDQPVLLKQRDKGRVVLKLTVWGMGKYHSNTWISCTLLCSSCHSNIL